MQLMSCVPQGVRVCARNSSLARAPGGGQQPGEMASVPVLHHLVGLVGDEVAGREPEDPLRRDRYRSFAVVSILELQSVLRPACCEGNSGCYEAKS